MKRIGLTQRVDVEPNHGERRDALDQRWSILMLTLGFCPVPLANNVGLVDQYIESLGLDGVILTGGNDVSEAPGGSDVAPERDRFEHLLLDVCTTGRLPILGVCRGLQLMNIHYGGGLDPIQDHVARPHRMDLDLTFFHGCQDSILVNSYHQFAIKQSSLSQNLRPIAWGQDGTIEAVVHEELPNFGVMWHPEREDSLAQHDLLMIRAAFGEGQA